MNKEIELTADLDSKQYKNLEHFVNKSFEKVGSHKRFMVRFFKDRVDVREPIDIRYKWTDGNNQLVIKKGALGSQKREETIIEVGKTNQLDKFVKLFTLIGFKEMIAVYREIEKFTNGKLEVSLIKASPYAFVEVEAVDGFKKNAKKDILDFYTTIGLTPFDRAGYQIYLRKLDREVNFIFPIRDYPQALLEKATWKKILHSTLFLS